MCLWQYTENLVLGCMMPSGKFVTRYPLRWAHNGWSRFRQPGYAHCTHIPSVAWAGSIHWQQRNLFNSGATLASAVMRLNEIFSKGWYVNPGMVRAQIQCENTISSSVCSKMPSFTGQYLHFTFPLRTNENGSHLRQKNFRSLFSIDPEEEVGDSTIP